MNADDVGAPSAQCVILAGGLGSRLGDRVGAVPKPMLDVAGRPFILHLMAWARRYGFARFLILAGYRAEVIREYFAGDAWRFGFSGDAEVEVVTEPEPLGTGGALHGAAPYLEPDFLLCNGDSLCRGDLGALCRPLAGTRFLACMAVRYVENGSRYGLVTLNGEGVAEFREKSAAENAGFVNAGMYWMRREILDRLPPGKSSLENETFPVLAASGELAGADMGKAYFIDIGVPGDLERARSDLLP